MMSTNFYALMNNETKVLSSFFMSGSDKEAGQYILDLLESSYKSIDKEEEKDRFVSNIRACSVVRVGYVDLVEHTLHDDFNVLLFLKDWKKEVTKENGTISS